MFHDDVRGFLLNVLVQKKTLFGRLAVFLGIFTSFPLEKKKRKREKERERQRESPQIKNR